MKEYFKTLETIFNVKIDIDYNLFSENCCMDIIKNALTIKSDSEETKEKVWSLISVHCNSYKLQLEKQAKENFINDIIYLKFENIDLMLNRSELLGFDFYIDRHAIIIEIEDLYKILKGQNEMILQQFKDKFYKIVHEVLENKNDIISYIGNNRFVICKAKEDNVEEKIKKLLKILKDKWGLQYKISIGDKYDMPGIEAVSYSFKDAENYMLIGKKYLKEEIIYTYEKVGIYLMFFNLGKFERQKITKFIDGVIEYGEKNRIDISEIISNYFENKFIATKTTSDMNITAARLKEILVDIKDMTNLDPNEFEDAVKIYVAFKIYNGESRWK